MEAAPVDIDRGPQLAAVYIAGCALSFVFVGMRLMARYSIARVGIDDWVMLATWVSICDPIFYVLDWFANTDNIQVVFVVLTVLLALFSFEGGTRHLIHLAQDAEHTKGLLMKNWISQSLAILCLGLGKIAIALLILRLLDRVSPWRRWSLHFVNGLTLVNTILMIVFNYVQCENPTALWDESVKPRTKCWDPSVQSSFSTYGAAMHAAIDFYLAILPATLVWGLKVHLRKKLALCALLGCGSMYSTPLRIDDHRADVKQHWHLRVDQSKQIEQAQRQIRLYVGDLFTLPMDWVSIVTDQHLRESALTTPVSKSSCSLYAAQFPPSDRFTLSIWDATPYP